MTTLTETLRETENHLDALNQLMEQRPIPAPGKNVTAAPPLNLNILSDIEELEQAIDEAANTLRRGFARWNETTLIPKTKALAYLQARAEIAPTICPTLSKLAQKILERANSKANQTTKIANYQVNRTICPNCQERTLWIYGHRIKCTTCNYQPQEETLSAAA